jgi:16S rRNA (uracil1498-N3)-methyltransferase
LRADAAPAFVFIAELPEPGGRGALAADERHHVVQVWRAAPGDRLSATDGRGALATLRLLDTGREAAFEVEYIERAERPQAITIACGAPEGARADWLIEKLAEFGVDRFQPLDGARDAWRWSAARAERFERLAIAALKQSRQRFRLIIAPPEPAQQWLASLTPGGARCLADRGGLPPGELPAPAGVAVGVSGPAGGWTGEERASFLSADFRPIRLASGVLRAETAGLALAALLARGAPGADAP